MRLPFAWLFLYSVFMPPGWSKKVRSDRTAILNSYDAMQVLNGQDLCADAIDSMRRYNESKGKLPEQEIEMLRIEAESQFARLQLFYLKKFGGYIPVLH